MARSKMYELMLKIGGRADSSLRAACEAADRNLASLGASAKNVGKVIAGATAAAAAAVGTIGVAAVNAAAEYETQLANISTLLTGTEAEVAARTGEIGGQILAVSNITGVATADLTDGMYQVVSAFGDSKDAISILETAAKSAAAGNATTTDSINLLSAVTKGYGDTSAQAVQKTADLAFATVRLGQTSFPELASSMGKVIPLAGTLGLEQEQLFGAMATLTGVTGSTSEVVTQLKATMQGFLSPSKNMAAALETMGYESGQALLESEGLQGALNLLMDSVDGNELAFAGLFSSVEAQTAVLAMAGEQAGNLTSKTAEMYQAAGSADTAFQRQTNTMKYTIQTIKNLGANFLTEVGQKILPYIKDLAEKALPVLQEKIPLIVDYVANKMIPAAVRAAEWIKKHKTLLLALAAGVITLVGTFKVLKTAVTVIQTVKSLSTIFKAASEGGGLLKKVFGLLNVKLLIIAAVIGVVIATIILLVKNWDKVKAAATAVWEKIKNTWAAAGDWFHEKVIDPVVNAFSTIVGAVTGFFSRLWENIKSVWVIVATWFHDKVITPIMSFFTGMRDGITSAWSAVAAWFNGNVVIPLVNFFSAIKNTVSGIFKGCWTIVQAIWKLAATWFLEKVIAPVLNSFSTVVGAVTGFFSKLWANITAIWNSVSTWVHDQVVTPVITVFSSVVNTVSGFFSTLWGNITAIWTAAPSWFGDNVITPVVNTFSTIVEAVSGFFSNLWGRVVDVWASAGTWFSDNVAAPIQNAFQAVSDFVKGIFNGLLGIVEGAINRIIGGLNKFIGGFSGIVGKAATFIGVDWSGISEIPQIALPRLAEGGIATAPILAEIGEGGEPEAVLPLSKLASLLDGQAGKPAPSQPSGQSGGSGETIMFAPVFNFYGETAREEAVEAGRISFAEFTRLYRQMKAEERRKRFAPA